MYKNVVKRLALVCFAMTVILEASVAGASGQPKVPLKPQLKARVRKLYSAYMKADWPALLEFIAPFVRECSTSQQWREGWTSDSPDHRLLSWRLKNIESDSEYTGQSFHVECTGLDYKVEAGALVVISQLDQEGDAAPTRGENYFHWVLINGTWFIAGPE